MKIFRIRHQTPHGSPPSSVASQRIGENERFVWEVLVPRLLHPSKLAFIHALLEHRRPLSVSELANAADISVENARYQCQSMKTSGVLEVVSVVPCATGGGDEPTYFFRTRDHLV